jgi:hypothetical protein
MTELAIRNDAELADSQPFGQDQSIARLAEWAKVAGAVHTLATGLCETQFVPKAYFKKPMEASAAILAGAEVGLSPMGALRAFDNIQGTPAPKAVTLRAIVQGCGHRVKIVESTPTRAVVSALRRGETEWQTSTWDLDRASQMDLLGKDQWKKQPQAMLVARATAEVCRWIASDAIMGMPYTAEEIRDGEHADQGSELPQVVQRASVADIVGQPAIGSTATPPTPPEQYVKPEIEPVSAPPAEPPADPITPKQRSAMFALFAQKGMTKPADQRTYIAEVMKRPSQSRAALSKDDAKTIIEHLNRLPDLPAEDAPKADDGAWPTPAEIPGGES